ncbi:MAG: patatin-like phospholipase family protein [Proteobacteria bacterium]|nr:patatin-like phospholipase family protein [Burkholderiales bacterium]
MHSGPGGSIPCQIVLALQGGGAVGAYQAGVYQAMHEADIDPDWVIGTSIGAIQAGIIAGNPPEQRLAKLQTFWDAMAIRRSMPMPGLFPGLGSVFTNFNTVARGIEGFFAPNPMAMLGQHAVLGIDRASYYSTKPLRDTLEALIDFDYLATGKTRLTVGAVNVRTGAMHYFDSRNERLRLDHIMASGALPPAFPAVRIDGEPYWDGGVYSNTPIEIVFDDNPRRDSVVFAVQLWNTEGPEPETLWQVTGRHKEIQYASRATSHTARQAQIHHMRHIIRELSLHLPEDARSREDVKELAAWGCATRMHLIRLDVPRLEHEDHTRDIDFSTQGIHARHQAGYACSRRVISEAPWTQAVDPSVGIVTHDFR